VLRAINGTPEDVEAAEIDRLTARLDEIENEIAGIPAVGATGIVIKLYVLARSECERSPGRDVDSAALDIDEACVLEASLLRDAARFAPEIAPFLRANLENPNSDRTAVKPI